MIGLPARGGGVQCRARRRACTSRTLGFSSRTLGFSSDFGGLPAPRSSCLVAPCLFSRRSASAGLTVGCLVDLKMIIS